MTQLTPWKLQIPETLSDGTVTLRQVRQTDVPDIVAAVQDPEIPRFTMIPSPYRERDALSFLAKLADDREAGTGATFAITEADDRLVGMLGMHEIESDHLVGTLGYWCSKDARGRGLVTAALRLVSRWAFDQLGLARLQMTIHEDNFSSQRVAARAGFRREGLLRSYRVQHGTRVDLEMWSLLPEDVPR